MALAALQAIREAGLEPGGDVAVIGFDDLEAAALAHPPLTTIRQDRRELGALAATRAIELVEGWRGDRDDRAAGRARRPRLVVVLASLDRAELASDVHLGTVAPAVRAGGVEESRPLTAGAAGPEGDAPHSGDLDGQPAAEGPAAPLSGRRR